MKRNLEDFLEELEFRLAGLRDKDRKEILKEYRAHVASCKNEGLNEQEILEAIGSPVRVAREFNRTYQVHENYRVYQHIFLAILVIGFVCLTQWFFGNASRAVLGNVPQVWLWNLSLLLLLPGTYWVATWRCQSQRAFPLFIAGVALVIGWSPLSARFAREMATIGFNGTFSGPLDPAEKAQLGVASDRIRTLVAEAQSLSYASDFAKKLTAIQPEIIKSKRLVALAVHSKAAFLTPVSTTKSPSIQFGYTNNPQTAHNRWRTMAPELGRFSDVFRQEVLDSMTATPAQILTRSFIWQSCAYYMGYIWLIGLFAERLPMSRRKRLATS